MPLRLRNERDPKKTLSMSAETWFSILELAEDYGWIPLGTLLPGWWEDPDPFPAGYDPYEPDEWNENRVSSDSCLVVLEDSLNLGDALERAYLDYEPEPVYNFAEVYLPGQGRIISRPCPGIGTISAVMDFCRLGSFRIERYD